MERRNFLKLTMGFVAGGAVLATAAQAAPLPPVSGEFKAAPAATNVEPAVVSQDEVDRVKPEQVRWHHRWHHRRWHHRHWRRHRW